jgi:hypothetical protein
VRQDPLRLGHAREPGGHVHAQQREEAVQRGQHLLEDVVVAVQAQAATRGEQRLRVHHAVDQACPRLAMYYHEPDLHVLLT